MKKVKKSTGIVFDIFLLGIPIVAYISTSYSLFIIPICIYASYVIFNQLKKRHEQEVFIEPKKLRLYTKGRNISLILILGCSAAIEVYVIYLDFLDSAT